MQMTKNKTMAILITLILASSMAISLAGIPNANAQAQSTQTTYAFIGATPNPVGVGQQTLLDLGITAQLNNVAMGWTGLTVTVTKPDGTTETLGPFRTDATGGTGYAYTPTMVGNYTLQTHFPQQTTTLTTVGGGIPFNTTMLASDSFTTTLVVQQQPITYNPGVPLPPEYWTRPINAQFRNWYSISGSSWMSNDFNAAPTSPHILWTKPLTTGGLVGGSLGLVGSGETSVGMENGDAYEGKWLKSLILAGNLYYQDAPGSTGSDMTGSRMPSTAVSVLYHCVDLRTGQELWTKTFLDNRTITFGQLYYWQSYNYQGTYAYLWVVVGTTWTAFDAASGDYRFSITNVPSGTMIRDSNDDIYMYTVDLANGWMALWNETALISMSGSWGSATYGRTYNATTGNYATASSTGTLGSYTTTGAAAAARAWSWNITIPKGLLGSVRAVNLTDRVVGSNLNFTDVNIWAFSLQSGQAGQLLYNNDWKAPAAWNTGNQTLSWATSDLPTNLGTVWSKETQQYYGFSLATGQYLWTTEKENYLNMYGAGRRVYNGNLYATGYGGTVYCYNIATGAVIWTYDPKDYYHEVLWSNNWPVSIYQASGGKLYLFQTEHSVNQPMPRNAAAFCLNATDGSVIWRVDGLYRTTNWGGQPLMGDSVIAMYNTYDQQVYAIGQGPSAVTVDAPLTSIELGQSLVIRGTVTDVSPGTTESSITLRFPNGVPAVSDASQGDWMKYVYAQFSQPTNATGVPVLIDVIDSNGNYRNIGTAISDSSGMFTFTWTPDITGSYTVIATFAGSNAYYESSAQTSFSVSAAPTVTPTATPQSNLATTADLMTYMVAVAIAIIIAIAIVGFLILRKHP